MKTLDFPLYMFIRVKRFALFLYNTFGSFYRNTFMSSSYTRFLLAVTLKKDYLLMFALLSI